MARTLYTAPLEASVSVKLVEVPGKSVTRVNGPLAEVARYTL